MPISIHDIATALESWAPIGSAESWDRVGLHVGDPQSIVQAGLVALDMTPEVLGEAINIGAQLIVTHHPLFFKPVHALTPAHPVGYLALRLAEAGIGLYCIHTNLDVAAGGVSFGLAEQLGLRNVQFLSTLKDQIVKLVTFVPEPNFEAVRSAILESGAGRIGNYDSCSFSVQGTGSFRALDGANPTIGDTGGAQEQVQEFRLEAEVVRWQLGSVIRALQESHPYDEVAYDIYPVEQPYRNAGLGAIGELESEVTLDEFLLRLAETLNNPAVRFTGERSSPIRRVAVCGGSGSSLIPLALQSGADAFVTADLSYHRFFDSVSAEGDVKMALIDPGHYETERVAEEILVDFLADRFPGVHWHRTQNKTSPVNTFVAPS